MCVCVCVCVCVCAVCVCVLCVCVCVCVCCVCVCFRPRRKLNRTEIEWLKTKKSCNTNKDRRWAMLSLYPSLAHKGGAWVQGYAQVIPIQAVVL